MKPKVLIATGNQGKVSEMMEVLGDLAIDFVTLADLNLSNDVDENGDTYTENSFLKSRYFFQKSRLPTIAEDSGLEVTALRGELGIKTRRWGAGESATDQQWLEYFLERMSTEPDRSARFCCAASFVDGETEQIFLGESKGALTEQPQCEIPCGIPVSALFVPEGHETVFAAMTPEQKNSVSHRGRAMHPLHQYLIEYFGL